MKIAMISPRALPVPPKEYGGTERVVHYLTEELVRRGHDVILFAAKGSRTSATLVEYPSSTKVKLLSFIIRHMPKDVDLIHDHLGIVAKANPPVPTIQQSHGAERCRKAQIPVYVSETMLRSIGKKKGYYVHNGIKLDDYEYKDDKDDYLLFLGRVSAAKGVHHAIHAAQKTGRRLIIAGLVGQDDKTYFERQIKPHLNEQISYVGSVGGSRKRELLARAYCVLFPTLCNEAFGLVPIEALASGTPVLGFQSGAVPEVLRGFPELVCATPDEMIRKLDSGFDFPSPALCRRYVEQHFTDRIMADGFIKLYKRIRKRNKYAIVKKSIWSKRERKLLGSKSAKDR